MGQIISYSYTATFGLTSFPMIPQKHVNNSKKFKGNTLRLVSILHWLTGDTVSVYLIFENMEPSLEGVEASV